MRKPDPCPHCGAYDDNPFKVILNCKKVNNCAYIRPHEREQLAVLRPEYATTGEQL